MSNQCLLIYLEGIEVSSCKYDEGLTTHRVLVEAAQLAEFKSPTQISIIIASIETCIMCGWNNYKLVA